VPLTTVFESFTPYHGDTVTPDGALHADRTTAINGDGSYKLVPRVRPEVGTGYEPDEPLG
jgi:hypothetical protein